MPSSLSASTPHHAGGGGGDGGGKRRRDHNTAARPRKKQKSLDAICASPAAAAAPPPADDSALRRSSRVRHPPSILDSSPVPSGRRKNRRHASSQPPSRGGGDGIRRSDEKGSERGTPVKSVDDPDAEESKNSEEWKSRLRTRVGKGFSKKRSFDYGETPLRVNRARREGKGSVASSPVSKRSGVLDSPLKSGRRGRGRGRRRILSDQVVSDDAEGGEVKMISVDGIVDGFDAQIESKSVVEIVDEGTVDRPVDNVVEVTCPQEEERKVVPDVQVDGEEVNELDSALQVRVVKEDEEEPNVSEKEKHDAESDEIMMDSADNIEENGPESNAVAADATLPGEVNKTIETFEKDNMNSANLDDKIARKDIKEGRRCGLCGGGTDGRPPKRVDQESVETDKDSYDGSSASEEPNYDAWDGFGDEPGWLGRLLGPIRDRFGIARVWVHQHCAVWSPEV